MVFIDIHDSNSLDESFLLWLFKSVPRKKKGH